MAKTPLEDIDNVKGMGWAFGSVLTASAMTLGIRILSETMDSRMIVFWRFAITTAAVLIAIAVFKKLRDDLHFSNPKEHLLRGVLIGIATHLGFYAITQIPLATVSVLFFTAPIFATIMSVIIHGEAIGPRRIGAILLGFIGAIVILRPGTTELEWGVIAALASSLTFAGALTMSRHLSKVDGSFSTLISANVISLVMSIPLIVPIYEAPSGSFAWFWVLALVVLGYGRQIADIKSYTLAEAAVIAPISYLRLVFLGLAGFLMYAEVPDRYTIIGAVVIIAASLYIAQREAQLKT